MFLVLEDGKDFRVQVVAYADGGTMKCIRTVLGQLNPTGSDIALLLLTDEASHQRIPSARKSTHAPE
jgi:hypothetical protein